jgi:hypothetical protein
MITTVVGGLSVLMFSYVTVYGVVKGFDRMMGKELPIQSMTLEQWRNK